MADDGRRSQSPWLKVLLAASLLMIAIGVYRCSTELPVPEDPGTVPEERSAPASWPAAEGPEPETASPVDGTEPVDGTGAGNVEDPPDSMNVIGSPPATEPR
jgi:hypothetical protein